MTEIKRVAAKLYSYLPPEQYALVVDGTKFRAVKLRPGSLLTDEEVLYWAFAQRGAEELGEDVAQAALAWEHLPLVSRPDNRGENTGLVCPRCGADKMADREGFFAYTLRVGETEQEFRERVVPCLGPRGYKEALRSRARGNNPTTMTGVGRLPAR